MTCRCCPRKPYTAWRFSNWKRWVDEQAAITGNRGFWRYQRRGTCLRAPRLRPYGVFRTARAQRQRTLASLATLMGLESAQGNEQYILDHTLVRRVEEHHFDVDSVSWNQRFPTESNGQPVNFDIARKHLPEVIPPDWVVQAYLGDPRQRADCRPAGFPACRPTGNSK